MVADLQLLAVHAQYAAQQIDLTRSWTREPKPSLTPRELECQWTMDGQERLRDRPDPVDQRVGGELPSAERHAPNWTWPASAQAVLKCVNLSIL